MYLDNNVRQQLFSMATDCKYDTIYQLTQAVVNAAPSETYSYDAVGNRRVAQPLG